MKLISISPIHVGSGEEIIPWEYAIENKHLKVYTIEKIISELRKKFYGQRLRNTLIDLRNEIRDYKFSKSLGEFLSKMNINLEENYRVERKINLKFGKEYKNVKSFIKTGGRVYIPGSEVKGALRTIFIFGVVYEELSKRNFRLYNDILKILKTALQESKEKTGKEKEKVWKKADMMLSNLIFRNGAPKNEAQYDIFKAVQVSDTNTLSPSEVLYVDGIQLVGSRRNSLEPHELLKEGTEFEISVRIDENMKEALRKTYNNPYLNYLTIENLKKFSHIFYRFLYNVEEEFFSKKGIKVNGLEKVKGKLEKEAFILRVGKHQGFLSTTVMLLFYMNKKLEKFYTDVYREVVPRPSSEVNKTRKLTFENKTLGWVELV